MDGCSARAMNWAATDGHLDTVKWLHENRAEVRRRKEEASIDFLYLVYK